MWFAMIASLLLADTLRGLMPTAPPGRLITPLMVSLALGLSVLGVAMLVPADQPPLRV